MLRVAISLPHGGKSPDVDPGSTFDADKDGKISFQEREEYIGATYAAAVASRLRVLGHEVRVYGDGDYSARVRDMAPWNPHIVLYPHLDVRTSPNPLFFYDPFSPITNGPALAHTVGRDVSSTFPELGSYRAVAASTTSSPGALNICNLHRRSTSITLVAEPLTTAMAATWVHAGQEHRLALLGAAIADGIDHYAKNHVAVSSPVAPDRATVPA